MNAHWQQDWLKLQKQYLDALTVAGKAALKRPFESPETSPDWIFDAGKPSGRAWETINSQFSELLTVLTNNGSEDFDWKSALRSYVQTAKKDIKDDMRRVQPADLQAEILASFEKLFDPVNKRAESSKDERYQEVCRFWQLYQQNCQRYRNYLKNIDLASLDIVQEKLFLLADNQENISSLREFYDLWVDSYEEAYETIILSGEYSELYGELVNSMLEFKACSQDLSRASSSEASESQQDLRNELNLVKKQQEQNKRHIEKLEEKIRNLIEEKPAAMASAEEKKKSGETASKPKHAERKS